MHLVERRRDFTGTLMIAAFLIIASTSKGGLITDLSSQFQLAAQDSTPIADPQVTEGDFFHAETASLANQAWHGTDEPWIQIVQSVNETGHDSNFGAMLIGDSPNVSRAGRKGGPGGGGGGSGAGGSGSGSASALNGVAQNPTSPIGVPTSIAIPNVPQSAPAAEVPSSGPAALAVAAVPAQGSASIPEQSPDLPDLLPEPQVSVAPPVVPEPDLVPTGNPSDPGVLTETETSTPNSAPKENAFVVPALYENPEPGSMLLLAIGAAALLVRRVAGARTRR